MPPPRKAKPKIRSPRIRASYLKASQPTYIWHDLFPQGMLSAIIGKQSAGKSLLTARVAVDLAGQGKRVIISNGENPRTIMSMPRLQASGMNKRTQKLIWVAGAAQRYKFPQDIDNGVLEEEIIRWNINLVLIDPLIAHLSGIQKRDDKIRDTVLDELTAIATRTNCAIVLTDHNLRSIKPKADLTEAVSVHIAQAIQAIYLIGKNPNDDQSRIMGLIKDNITGPRATMEFIIDADEDFRSTEVSLAYAGELEEPFNLRSLLVTKEGETGRPPDKLEAAVSWVTTFLENAPDHQWLAKDLKAAGVASGHTRKTLDNAAREIGIEKQPPTGGKNCVWVLPQDVIDMLHGFGDEEADEDDEEGGEAEGV